MIRFPTKTVSESRVAAEWETLLGRTPSDLFRIGPYPELIGRAVADLKVAADGAPGVLELHRNSSEPFVLPDAPIPCYFEGTYRPDHPTAVLPVMAVAVNGVIESVARVSAEPSVRGRWESLVPRRCLKNGPNAARFYLIEPDGEGWRLRACPTRQVEPVVKRGE